MSEQVEHEIYSLAKTIMDVAEKIDRKAREAKSADIQESLKELLKGFQQELSKGITDSQKVLDTLQGQKADIDKLDNIATKAVEESKLNPEQTNKLDRKAVLKEARAEMIKVGFSQDAIAKTQSAINKTFDELSKVLNMNDVLKETRKDMQAKGFDKNTIEKTEQAIKNTFTPIEPSKEKSIFSSLTMRDPEEAFRNAVKAGLKNPNDYMYMNSGEGKDYFKHLDTKDYKEFKISKESLLKAPIMNRDEYLESKNIHAKPEQEHIRNITEADRIADIFGFDDPNNPLFQGKNEVVKPVREHIKNTEIAATVEMDSFLVQEQFVEQVREFKAEHKNVTHSNNLQEIQGKDIELQKGLTKAEFMEHFKEQLKNSKDFDKDMKGQLESILDNVTTKVISPDYGKPVEWAVAKTAKKNETLVQFQEYINNRKELNSRGKLDETIKEAKQKTLEKQKETLEKRQNKEQTRNKPQQQAKSR